MSVRRPKMQIKPKVSTRAMAAKASVDVAAKKKAELAIKKVETSVTDNEQMNQPSDVVDSSSPPLTTSFVEVTDNEDNRTIGDSFNRTVSEDNTQIEKQVMNTIADQLPDKAIDTKTKTLAKGETKSEKASKTRGKGQTSRKRKACRNGQTSDKSAMRMKDLLLYNPPMTDDQKEIREKNAEHSDQQVSEQESDQNITPKEVTEETIDKSEETTVGPRVKVGSDGQLILDEESVIVKRKKSNALDGPALLESASTTSACTNYSSFRNKNRSASKHRWTEHETIRFYSALNTIGTDFTLMADLFFRGKRSRLDLRNKFKKEEKINKLMIDEALFSPNTFINQCPELDELLADSSDTDDDRQQKNEKRKSVKDKA